MIIYSHCLEPMCCTLPGFTHIRNLRNCWGLVMQAVRRTEPQVKMNKNRCNGRLSEDDSTVIASLELGYQVKFCRVKQCRFIWPLQFSGVRVFLWHDVALWIKTVVCVCVFFHCFAIVSSWVLKGPGDNQKLKRKEGFPHNSKSTLPPVFRRVHGNQGQKLRLGWNHINHR